MTWPPVARHHARYHQSGHREQTLDIGVYHRVPVCRVAFILLVQAESQPGVVDEHVYLLPSLAERRDGLGGSLGVAHVERQRHHLGAHSLQRGLDFLQPVGSAPSDYQIVSACRKLTGAGFADATCGTGDESCLLHCHCHLGYVFLCVAIVSLPVCPAHSLRSRKPERDARLCRGARARSRAIRCSRGRRRRQPLACRRPR